MYKRRKLLKFFIGQFGVKTLSLFSKWNRNFKFWIFWLRSPQTVVWSSRLLYYIVELLGCGYCSDGINLHYKIQSWREEVWLDQQTPRDWWIFFWREKRKTKPTLKRRQCTDWSGQTLRFERNWETIHLDSTKGFSIFSECKILHFLLPHLLLGELTFEIIIAFWILVSKVEFQ